MGPPDALNWAAPADHLKLPCLRRQRPAIGRIKITAYAPRSSVQNCSPKLAIRRPACSPQWLLLLISRSVASCWRYPSSRCLFARLMRPARQISPPSAARTFFGGEEE